MSNAIGGTVLSDDLDLNGLAEQIDDGKFRRIEAVLVQRGEQILFEGYFRKSGPQTRIDARSAGKSLTALAVGLAIEDGAIAGVDVPAWRFFDTDDDPSKSDPLKQAITISDLLTMTSALDCNDWRRSPGHEERMYRQSHWTDFALSIPSDKDYVRGPQGYGRFSYCTAGVFLLGQIVERAVGERFDDYVQRRLFDPLKIAGADWTRSPSGEVQSGGQLGLTARDFAKIGRLVIDHIRPNGQQSGDAIISQAWIKQMLTPRAMATPTDAYGYLWWFRVFHANGAEHHAAYMSGNGGNIIAIFPDIQTVIVVLATNYNRKNMTVLSRSVIEDHILPAMDAYLAAEKR